MPAGTARVLHTQQVHYFRKRINFNDIGIAAGVFVGTFPIGAMIIDVVTRVNIVFNAGTTNALNYGTTALGAQIGTDAATLGGRRVTTGIGLVFAADTDFFVSYAQTGTVATTGQADLVIAYVPNNDQ